MTLKLLNARNTDFKNSDASMSVGNIIIVALRETMTSSIAMLR
jgi:hypothetical protein